MTRLKFATTAVSLALFALQISGCGSDKSPAASAPATAATAAPAAQQTATAAPPAAVDPAATQAAMARFHPLDPNVFSHPLNSLDGNPTSLAEYKGKTLLVVNVASKCGLTPQYAELEALQKKYGPRGFEVVGFPCNQFGGQEPGTAAEIKEFCSLTYGVTFPMMEKIEVNGPGRHPIYSVLTSIPDDDGTADDIEWNFEKFVISADGTKVRRFRPRTKPQSPEVVAAIEAALAAI